MFIRLDSGHLDQRPPPMPNVQERIIRQYAEWTVLSALRSGSRIKSRDDVYGALRTVDFEPLFDKALGSISAGEFNAWHERSVARLRRHEQRLTVGWAAKMLNVYLKTSCYIGALGRHHLSEAIHPPIDSGLWRGLRRAFPDRPDILGETHCVKSIKDIQDYPCYLRIVAGCRLAARALDCKLIEIEQLWEGTATPVRKRGNRA